MCHEFNFFFDFFSLFFLKMQMIVEVCDNPVGINTAVRQNSTEFNYKL